MKLKGIQSIIAFFILSSCATTNLKGTYQSNFQDLGMFTTTIEFKSDNKFNYNIFGDITNRDLPGTYTVIDNVVYLKFDAPKEIDFTSQPKDSISIDVLLSNNYHNYELRTINDLEYHQKLLIKRNKLFVYRLDTEELIKRAEKYPETNNFLFRGSKVRKRRYFLKKLN